MRIFDAEIRRILSRRLVRLLFLLTAIGFVIAGIVVFFKSSEGLGSSAGFVTPAEGNVDLLAATDDRFHMRKFRGISEGMNGLFIPLFMLLGASFMGAEWSTRSITASLTFEPRRMLLLTGKLAASVAVAFIATFVFLAFLFMCLLPSGLFRGTTTGMDATWWFNLLKDVTRTGLLASFAVTFGFGIATMGRNAAAALGVAFVYIAIIEQLIRQWRPNLQRWLVGDSIAIFASGHPDPFLTPGRSVLESGLTLLFYGGVIFAAALVFFRNRDVA